MNKLTITTNVSERDLVEWCLNMKSSGCDPMIVLSFYALAKRWHMDKLVYYLGLMRE